MRKVSEILGKNIISLYEGKRIGIIENVAFDKKLKKLKSFIVYDEDGDDIDRLFVPSGGVKIEGENAVMIKNLEKVVEDTKNIYSKKNPMNADVYNLKGTLLGKVNEVLIASDTNDIYSLLLNDGTEILQTQIVSGDFKTIVVQGPGEEFPVLTSPKKKTLALTEEAEAENLNVRTDKSGPELQETLTKKEESINIDSINSSGIQENIPAESQKKLIKTEIITNTLSSAQDTVPYNVIENVKDKIIYSVNNGEKQKKNYPDTDNGKAPEELPVNLRRLSAHFDFLIGRLVKYDVYNAKNEKIVDGGTIITNSVLDVCKTWGKLIILARNSAR